MRRINKMEEGALGVDSGDDGFHGDFLAAGESDAGDAAIFDEDLADFRIGADFRAGLFGGFGERARKGTEPAARKRSGANRMGIGGSAEKKDGGRTGGPGAKRVPKKAACGDGGAKK